MVTKRSHILKQTCSWTLSVQLQVCLSMCDLFVITRHERIKVPDAFFYKQRFFFNWASVLLNFSWIAYVLLNIFKHQHTEKLLILTILMPIPRPRPIYMLYLRDLFFIFIMTNRMKTEALVLLRIFKNMSYYF